MNEPVVAPSADEKNIAVLTHLGGIFFSFVPALIVWPLSVSRRARRSISRSPS